MFRVEGLECRVLPQGVGGLYGIHQSYPVCAIFFRGCLKLVWGLQRI